MGHPCDPADALCLDSLEFEGVQSTAAAAAAATWEPSRGDLLIAWITIPVLVLAAASWWLQGGRRKPKRATQDRRQAAAATPPAPPRATASPVAGTAWQPRHVVTSPPSRTNGASRRSGGVWGVVDAAASLLLLPVSFAQTAMHVVGLRLQQDAGATPQAAAAIPGSQAAGGGSLPGSSNRFGLGTDEAAALLEDDDWGEEGGGPSELTKSALRQLERTPEFRAFLRARGLAARDVERAARLLDTYRRLRYLDPAGFWDLLRPSARPLYHTRAPSRLVLAAHYLLSTAANLAAAAAAARLLLGLPALSLPVRGAAAALLAWVVLAPWLHARPTAGGLFGLWYEEPRWGHAAPAWRCVAAALLEAAYVAASAGVGAAVSLWLRCMSDRQQSVGELLAGIQVVQELGQLQWDEDERAEQTQDVR